MAAVAVAVAAAVAVVAVVVSAGSFCDPGVKSKPGLFPSASRLFLCRDRAHQWVPRPLECLAGADF